MNYRTSKETIALCMRNIASMQRGMVSSDDDSSSSSEEEICYDLKIDYSIKRIGKKKIDKPEE